jgi:hypothetical protein
MERIIGIDLRGGWSRDDQMKAERLRHHRAAVARCVRSGLLRLCGPVPPGGRRACCAA